MIDFEHLNYLFALGLLPLLVALFLMVVYWRKRKLQKIGNEQLVNEQILGFIPGRNALKFILAASALLLIIVGWANLRTPLEDKGESVQRKGIDVIIALDVSKSMLATDLQPNRLTRAKQLIMRLTDKMKNHRVALVLFAGKSYLKMPLSVDYNRLKMLLDNVSPASVPTQGTVLAEAIEMATNSFAQNERKYKSLILITDGEDHDENAIEKTRAAAEQGVVVHTVGVGSPQGITLFDPETNAVKLDENGNPVISKLNEDELKQIASAGHGTYSLLQNTDAVAANIMSELDGMEQKNITGELFSDANYSSYFQYFLFAGFLLLVAEWIIPGASRRKLNKNGSLA